MKKLIVLLIFFCFCISFISCAAAPTEDTQKENTEQIPVVDLGGLSVSILQAWEVTSPLSYKTDTLFSDLMVARIDEIQNTLNCKVNLVYQSDIKGTVQAATATGAIDGDIISDG